MAGNVIDSFLIALGFQIDPAGAKQAKKVIDETKDNLLSMGTAVKAFVAGFAIKEVADIGSTFEQNQIQVAGFLTALGMAEDFNTDGLQKAGDIIGQITKDAAILPGEAEDYIEVFKAGLPYVQAAMPGGSLEDITNFTNKLTAIGKSFKLDSGLIAREFDHMLSPGKGMASLRLPLFRTLLTFMHKIPGQAKLTAESFNAMSESKRLEMLQKTFGELQPMLDASADSFDAMWGAAVSGAKTFTREATKGVFKKMKEGIQEVTALFIGADGKLTPLGKGIADNAKMILGWIGQVIAAGGGLLKWLVTSEVGTLALKVAMGLLGTALAGLALQKTIDMFSKLTKLLINPKLLLVGALAILIALVAEDLYMFFTNGKSVIGLLKEKFPAAFYAVSTAIGVAIGLFIALKVAAVGSAIATAIAWGPVLIPILLVITAIGALIGLVAVLYKKWPAFAEVVDRIGNGFVVMADAIERAVRAMSRFLGFATESQALADFNVGNFDRNGVTPDDPNEVPSFLAKPATTSGAGAVTRTVTNTSGKQVNVHVDKPHIVIQTNDPQKMGEEFQRQVTRAGQKAYR
jgi:hypothetical protein